MEHPDGTRTNKKISRNAQGEHTRIGLSIAYRNAQHRHRTSGGLDSWFSTFGHILLARWDIMACMTTLDAEQKYRFVAFCVLS